MVMNLYDAKAALSKLVDRAAAGDEIVIAKAGKPMARLVPLAPKRKRSRGFGAWKGKVWMAPDFDAPLPKEIQAYFDGKMPLQTNQRRAKRRRKKP